MKEQVERDVEFFFKHTTDDLGRLRNLSWVDSQSQIQLAVIEYCGI
jgi:hypothetical protein